MRSHLYLSLQCLRCALATRNNRLENRVQFLATVCHFARLVRCNTQWNKHICSPVNLDGFPKWVVIQLYPLQWHILTSVSNWVL